MRFIYSIPILYFLVESSAPRKMHRRLVPAPTFPPTSQNMYYEYSESTEEEIGPQNHRYLRPTEMQEEDYEKLSARTANRKKKCRCSCKQCMYSVRPCCQSTCMSCMMQPSNVVYVPFPVPFLTLNITTPAPPSTTTCKHTSTTCKSTTHSCNHVAHIRHIDPSILRNPEDNAIAEVTLLDYIEPKYATANVDNDSKNNRPVYNRFPKYGIVPIPDNMALRLMQQLKTAKELNRADKSRAFRLRKVRW